MKKLKRNAVVLTVMLFVCAAVYLNWSYNREVEKASTAGTKTDVPASEDDGGAAPVDETGDAGTGSAQTLENLIPEDDAGLYYSVTGASEDGISDPTAAESPEDGGEAPASTANDDYAEYFAQVRLERAQARDEAAATLTAVAEAGGASQETIDGALAAMTRLAQNAVTETELENLIRAKGFIDCVVYLSDDGAKVTVAADGGLNQASVAKITDVIVSQTPLTASDLTVIEIK